VIPPPGFIDNAAIVRDLGSIVGTPDLMVEQLTAGITHQLKQLRAGPKQLAGPVEFLNTIGQRPQQSGEPLGPSFIVHFIMLCHGNLEGAALPSFKFMCLLPINIMQGRTHKEKVRVCTNWCNPIYFHLTPFTKGA
jgi:hypothetical protein